MTTVNLDYYTPASVEDLLSRLADLGSRAKVIAGGTDLVPAMRKSTLSADTEALVSLKGVPLRYIRETAEDLHIGAAATHTDVATSPLVRASAPLLATGCGKVGSLQIRNVATVGGNVCNAGPSADSSAPLMALGARLHLASKARGIREVPIGQFYVGPGQSVRGPDEVLTEIIVPKLGARTAGLYEKFSPRGFMDLAWVGVAVIVGLDESLNQCVDVRIGLSAVSPAPMRAIKAEEVIRGRTVTDDIIDQMARTASEECNPNPRSRRVPAWYRREIVRTLTGRLFRQAVDAARGSARAGHVTTGVAGATDGSGK